VISSIERVDTSEGCTPAEAAYAARYPSSMARKPLRVPVTTADVWTAATALEHDTAPTPEIEIPGHMSHVGVAGLCAKVPATHSTHERFVAAASKGE
jgi:hypothetical protein